MNCRRFQNDLYEYLDGSLPPGAQAAAEIHLADCAACRERLDWERRVAQAMGDTFRRATEPLELPLSVSRLGQAVVAREGAVARHEGGTVLSWLRLAWRLELAAAVLVLLGGGVLLLRGPGLGGARPPQHVADSPVTVQLSYIVPVYTFHHEGGTVIDALTYQTNTVSQGLATKVASLH